MKKITNKNYRKFLDEGIIDLIGPRQIKQALNNVKCKYATEGKALLLTLYFTGGRPIEVLNLKAENITREKNHIIIKMPPSKGGLPRPIYLESKNELVLELYNYASGLFPGMFLFHHYKGSYIRKWRTKDGEEMEREEVSDKLRYYVYRWFDGVVSDSIPPYFLRHNRFSKLAERGVDLKEIQMLKGSRSIEGVRPYIHLSTKTAKNLARKID